MPATLTDIMERASQALVDTDYLTCESLCLEALAEARRSVDWSYYARILLPLQEARRQRRMIAAERQIKLGTAETEGSLLDWLRLPDAGCIAVTRPHLAEEAKALRSTARQQRRHIEVLYADNTATASPWTLRSVAGPPVTCQFKAPDDPAGNWFLDACEALGDAALAQVHAPLGDVRRIEQLEQMLEVVTDHEILHQRLGDAARAMH